MSIAFSRFLPEVMPYVPMVPETVAINAIRNAAIEFCNKSHWLIHECEAIMGIADIADYDIAPPDDCEILRVIDAWYEGRALVGKSEEELSQLLAEDWRTYASTPSYYTQISYCELRLVPMPSETVVGALKVIAAIQPTRTATEGPDSLFDRWLEPICRGARARLYEMPQQPYTDFRAAERCAIYFSAGISEAKRERNRGLTRGPLRIRPPRFI